MPSCAAHVSTVVKAATPVVQSTPVSSMVQVPPVSTMMVHQVPSVTTMIVTSRSMEPPITEICEVVKPAVQEVVRDVVRKRNEAHTIVQQRPVVELVEKVVEVPQYLIEERHETVPVVFQHKQVVEVPEVTVLELTTEVSLIEYQEAAEGAGTQLRACGSARGGTSRCSQGVPY